MGSLTVECDTELVSDGYHTFDELYKHRNALFMALFCQFPELGWYSKLHHDGGFHDGYFIAGMRLSTGDITYHLPERFWPMAKKSGAIELLKGRRWEGSSSNEAVTRLLHWAKLAIEPCAFEVGDRVTTDYDPQKTYLVRTVMKVTPYYPSASQSGWKVTTQDANGNELECDAGWLMSAR